MAKVLSTKPRRISTSHLVDLVLPMCFQSCNDEELDQLADLVFEIEEKYFNRRKFNEAGACLLILLSSFAKRFDQSKASRLQ